MTIGVDPVILSLGPVAVRWLGVLAVLGVLLGTCVAMREAKTTGGLVLDALAIGLPVGAVGARALYVLAGWDYYFTRPEAIWQLQPQGMSLWGGLVAGGLAAAWLLRRGPLDRLLVADAAAVGLPLAVAVGRLGAFLDGSGQGTPTSMPWATMYSSPLAGTPDFGVPRHPAQLYDALAALLVLAAVLAVPHARPAGLRFWTFLALYGAARVALSPVRLDPAFLLGLQADALLAILAIVFALLQASRGLWQQARPAPSQTFT